MANVERLRDRHGTERWYYRVGKEPRGPSLPAWGTAEFLPAWQAAHQAHHDGAKLAVLGAARTKPGSLSAALVDYYASRDWTDELGEGTRKKRRQLLEKLREEFGDAPLAKLSRDHIDGLMARLTPSAQRNWVKALRGLMKYCVAKRLIKADPTLGVSKAKLARSDGHIAWTEDDVATFRAKFPLGSRERLGLEIMLNLGLRRTDAARLGPSDIKLIDGRHWLIDFEPQKTARTSGVKISVPLHPDLVAAIDAMTVVSTRTFMVGEARGRVGQPFKTGESFGAWIREAYDAAGLPDIASHGLRKLAAIRLAFSGASVTELMKIFGWTTIAQAQIYVDQADRMRMAGQAMDRLQAYQNANKVSPTLSPGLGKKSKKTS